MTKLLRIFVLTLCLLAVACPTFAANNWAGSNAFAVWSLDDSTGLVLTDGIGSNDLTDYNTVQQDTVDYKEGNGCADFEVDNDEILYSVDTNLDAGFPGKGGGSEMDFSVCAWVQPESFGDALAGLVSKYDAGTKSFGLILVQADEKIYWGIGYNGGADATWKAFGTACAVGIWYHIGATYTAADNSMKLRIWDDNAGSLLGTNVTETAGGNMSPDSAVFGIGYYNNDVDTSSFDGQIDEVVIFAGEALSDADIDKIRAGTYGAAVGNPWYYYQQQQ